MASGGCLGWWIATRLLRSAVLYRRHDSLRAGSIFDPQCQWAGWSRQTHGIHIALSRPRKLAVVYQLQACRAWTYTVRRDTPSGGELFQGNGSSGTQKRTASKGGEFSQYGAPTGEDAEKLIRGVNVRPLTALFCPPQPQISEALTPGHLLYHTVQMLQFILQEATGAAP